MANPIVRSGLFASSRDAFISVSGWQQPIAEPAGRTGDLGSSEAKRMDVRTANRRIMLLPIANQQVRLSWAFQVGMHRPVCAEATVVFGRILSACIDAFGRHRK